MSHRVNAFVTLRTEGVGVIVDLTDGRLPALLHWGPDPGAITVDGTDLNARDGGAIKGGGPIRITAREDAEIVMVDSE